MDQAEYGNMKFTPSPNGTRITLQVGRVGYAIGKKGRTIKKLSQDIKELLGAENVQIEVDQLEDPELNPEVMASRLAVALERGRHFRRTAYGTIRRIMAKGAKGVEIIVSGKVTSQRARTEKFRDGFIAKTGDPKRKYVIEGHAVAKIKRGVLGVTVRIMVPEAHLPDQVNIIAEPTHVSRDIPRDEDDSIFEEEFDEETFDEVPEDILGEELPKEATEAADDEDEFDLEE